MSRIRPESRPWGNEKPSCARLTAGPILLKAFRPPLVRKYNSGTVSQDPALHDIHLIQAVARGNDAALMELFDRYGDRVLGLAVKISGNSMVAEEIAQEVFLKLWQIADRYDPGRGRFGTWLLTITRNAAIDRVRKDGRRPASDYLDWLEDDWRDELRDPRFEGEEARWHSLRFALLELPPEQRAAIVLAYYQGMSHSQIAGYLDVPLGTVKTRIRLGMEKLRRAWHVNASEVPDQDVYESKKDAE